MTKDFGFLILLRFYLLCFLLKTAVAIPLKKSRKRKINVFLRGSCFFPYLFIKTLLSNIFFALFCEEFRIVSHHEDEQDNQGQYPLDVNFQSSGEFQPFARIGFCQEVVPAPAHFPAAEQDEDQTAKRQDVLAYKEVFQIQHCGVRAEGLEAAPQVIAQYTRHGQQNDEIGRAHV